jgi:hypothetical protein
MHYPPYHHRHLYHWETLADISASDASILYLHLQISSSAILYYVGAQRLRWLLRPFWVAVQLPTGLRVRILLITCYPRHVTRNTG